MKVIAAGATDTNSYIQHFKLSGIAVEVIPIDKLVSYLRFEGLGNVAADAIVCFANVDYTLSSRRDSLWEQTITASVDEAIALGENLSGLPGHVAMADGRKWSSVPFIIALRESSHLDFGFTEAQSLKWTILGIDKKEDLSASVKSVIYAYHQRLLSELDNLGFLVSFDKGRYRIGPALRDTRQAEGSIYYGPADRRRITKYLTISRDFYGVQHEVEAFEALLNNPQTKESDLHNFFEDHPHFLALNGWAEPLSHLRFESQYGTVLIPDFVLKPIVAAERDNRWEVLDLKRHDVPLTTGKGNRARFSQQVAAAITQLRDYGDYFANPSNAQTVLAALGKPIRHPKLAVLVGRLPRGSQAELLNLAQSREAVVRIVTYDEILEAQRELL